MQNTSKYITLANTEKGSSVVLLLFFYTSRHIQDLYFKERLSGEYNFVNPVYRCTADFKTYGSHFSVIITDI